MTEKEKQKRLVRAALLAASAAMIAFGVLHGEPKTVLHKAVNLCLECIGIG